jgi:hypothetical protein
MVFGSKKHIYTAPRPFILAPYTMDLSLRRVLTG